MVQLLRMRMFQMKKMKIEANGSEEFSHCCCCSCCCCCVIVSHLPFFSEYYISSLLCVTRSCFFSFVFSTFGMIVSCCSFCGLLYVLFGVVLCL